MVKNPTSLISQKSYHDTGILFFIDRVSPDALQKGTAISNRDLASESPQTPLPSFHDWKEPDTSDKISPLLLLRVRPDYLELLLGKRFFFKVDFGVDHGVFNKFKIPAQVTNLLVLFEIR